MNAWASVFVLTTVFLADAAKIVVYSPTITRSHMQMHAKIADVLALEGHDVTVIEVEYLVDPSSVDYVQNAKRRVFHLPQPRTTLKPDMSAIILSAFNPTSFLDHLQFVRKYERVFQSSCEKHVNHGEVLRFLRSNKFDFVITEHVDLCGSAMSHAAGIRTHVLVSTCPLFEHTASVLGLESSFSYVPSFVPGIQSRGGGFWSRLQNAIGWSVNFAGLRYGSRLVTATFRQKFGPDFPDVDEIVAKSTAMVLVNADEFLDFPRPVFHNFVYIGGLGLGSDKTTENTTNNGNHLESVLKRGKRGVIFFSLGSVTSTRFLPPTFMPNLIVAMKSMPDYQFVVKVNLEDVTLYSSLNFTNIHFVHWVSQTELLADLRVRLFITHSGQNSIMEAAFSGTPLVMLPFFVDQHRNAAAVERNGWGRVFEKRSLLTEPNELAQIITQVLGNKHYARNAQRLSRVLKNRPYPAERRLCDAIRLLELADGRLPELQPDSRTMSLVQRHSWDIIAAVVTFFVLIVQIAAFLIYKLVSRQQNQLRRLLTYAPKKISHICPRAKFGHYKFVGEEKTLNIYENELETTQRSSKHKPKLNC